MKMFFVLLLGIYALFGASAGGWMLQAIAFALAISWVNNRNSFVKQNTSLIDFRLPPEQHGVHELQVYGQGNTVVLERDPVLPQGRPRPFPAVLHRNLQLQERTNACRNIDCVLCSLCG